MWAAFGNRRPRYAEWSEPDGFGISSPESVLRALTHDDDDLTVDYSAADLDGYADGDTVGTWPARRGGLDLSTVAGTPEYRDPDQTLRAPGVYYAASGEVHESAAAIDYSAGPGVTVLSVWQTSAATPATERGITLAGGAARVSATNGRGISHYRTAQLLTVLHWSDGPSPDALLIQRDNDTDGNGPWVMVSTHCLSGAAAGQTIRFWVNGDEDLGVESGPTDGTWQSDLRVRLGAEDNDGSFTNGIAGRIARVIATPHALSADQAVHASDLLATITRAH